MHPDFHCQVDHPLQRQIYLLFTFFCNFKSSLKECFSCTFKCNINWTLKSTFIELLGALYRTSKYINMCNFKCNSILNSNAPLSTAWNEPSDISLFRSWVYYFVHLQIYPQGNPQLYWQMHPQVHHRMLCQIYPFFHVHLHLQLLFKRNSKVHIQVQLLKHLYVDR